MASSSQEDELDKKTAFLTLAGSISYGTDISNENYQSDVDIRGIYLHTKEEILTCRPTDETIGSKDADILLYPLCKIVHLLKNCNPDVIPLLGVKKEHILKMSPEGKLLVDNADLFLSKRAGNCFHLFWWICNATIKSYRASINDGKQKVDIL